MYSQLRIYSDGGSRGNPGPAATAFVVLDENSVILKKESEFIGVNTNNQAEYKGLIRALKYARQFKSKKVTCHLDSLLVIKHLTGEYRVKDPELKKLWTEVQDLKKSFKEIVFVHVPRTNQYIQTVDRLLNRTLDAST